MGSFLAVVALAFALGGCATAPQGAVVPRVVEKPVDTSPTVVIPPEPIEEPLPNRSAKAVAETARIRAEQWKAYALELRVLLKPFEKKP